MENARIHSDCTSMINIREKSNVSSPIVARVAVGSIVQIKKQNKEWSIVSHNGKTGYVMNQFLVFGESKK